MWNVHALNVKAKLRLNIEISLETKKFDGELFALRAVASPSSLADTLHPPLNQGKNAKFRYKYSQNCCNFSCMLNGNFSKVVIPVKLRKCMQCLQV